MVQRPLTAVCGQESKGIADVAAYVMTAREQCRNARGVCILLCSFFFFLASFSVGFWEWPRGDAAKDRGRPAGRGGRTRDLRALPRTHWLTQCLRGRRRSLEDPFAVGNEAGWRIRGPASQGPIGLSLVPPAPARLRQRCRGSVWTQGGPLTRHVPFLRLPRSGRSTEYCGAVYGVRGRRVERPHKMMRSLLTEKAIIRIYWEVARQTSLLIMCLPESANGVLPQVDKGTVNTISRELHDPILP